MGTRLNILHLIETGGPGGAETVFRNLVTGLPPDRWRSVPVIPVVGWLHESLLQAGVRPIVLDGDRENTTRLLLRLLYGRIPPENQKAPTMKHMPASRKDHLFIPSNWWN